MRRRALLTAALLSRSAMLLDAASALADNQRRCGCCGRSICRRCRCFIMEHERLIERTAEAMGLRRAGA